VQQGNAPALSRRALPDIQRVWYNPFSWGKDDETEKAAPASVPKSEPTSYQEPTLDPTRNKVKAGTTVAGQGAKAGSSIFEGIENGKFEKIGITDSKYADDPTGKADAIKDSTTSASSIGLAASTIALFTALYRLFNDWEKESSNSARKQLVDAVKASIVTSRESTNIARTAQAAGVAGAQGLAIVTGLGLAVNVIDFALQMVKLFETSGASGEADKEIAKLTDSKTPLTVDQQKMLNALTRLSSSAKREWYRSLVRAGSDLLGIAGQITILSTAPTGFGAAVGGALVIAGGIGQGVVALERQIQEWMLADEVQKSRADVKAAQSALEGASDEDKSAKQEELDNAIKANLLIDDFAAARELIKSAGSLFDQDGNVDEAAVKIVVQFGLSKEWLQFYVDSSDKDSLLDKGARIVCDFVGKAANPMNLRETLKAAAEKLKNGIKWVATAGYWVLKYTTKTVLMLATIPFTPLMGLWSMLTSNPDLGTDFFDAYEGAIDNGFNWLEKPREKSEKSSTEAPKEAKPTKAKASTKGDYFSSEDELDEQTRRWVIPIIHSYFSEKKERGTDVKADTVTSLLSTPYKNLEAMVKKPHADGTAPYAPPAMQMATINSVIREEIVFEIKKLSIIRINIGTLTVTDGKVAFKYIGSEKEKTRGWFAGLRGREAATDEDRFKSKYVEYGSPIE